MTEENARSLLDRWVTLSLCLDWSGSAPIMRETENFLKAAPSAPDSAVNVDELTDYIIHNFFDEMPSRTCAENMLKKFVVTHRAALTPTDAGTERK